MSNTDARVWHPWLRIHRVLRVMLTLARAAERDSARGVVQLADRRATWRDQPMI